MEDHYAGFMDAFKRYMKEHPNSKKTPADFKEDEAPKKSKGLSDMSKEELAAERDRLLSKEVRKTLSEDEIQKRQRALKEEMRRRKSARLAHLRRLRSLRRKQSSDDLLARGRRLFVQLREEIGPDPSGDYGEVSEMVALTLGATAGRQGMSETDLRRWLQSSYGNLWVRETGMRPGLDLKDIQKLLLKGYNRTKRASKLDVFDFFDGSDKPEIDPLAEARASMGAQPYLIPAESVLSPQGLRITGPGVYWSQGGRKWMIQTGARSEAEAKTLGLKVQKNLKSKGSLSASDPFLHHMPLLVVWSEGWVELPGIPEKKRDTEVRDTKYVLTKKGLDFFGSRGFSLGGRKGAYTMTIKPVLKEHKGKFSTTTVRAATLEDLEKKLDQAIQMLSGNKVAAYGDPYWIQAKYPGVSQDGTPFKKGERVLYYPRNKVFLVGPKAEQAWRDFQAAVADEDFYNY